MLILAVGEINGRPIDQVISAVVFSNSSLMYVCMPADRVSGLDEVRDFTEDLNEISTGPI